MNAIKRELLTLFSLKSVWIVSAIVVFICGYFMYQNYNNAQTNVNYMIEEYSESDESDAEYAKQIKGELEGTYSALSVDKFINNAYGILIGIGLLAFPVIGIIFVADDYTKGTIKNKVVYNGLQNFILGKIISIIVYLLSFIAFYSIFQYIEIKILYKKYLQNIELKGLVNLDNIKSGYVSNVGVIMVTIVVLLFYIMLCMLFTFIGKNMLLGFGALLITNYFVLPIKYSPHQIFNWLINRVFNITEYSPFNFSSKVTFDQNVIPYSLLIGYFVIMIGTFFLVSKLQRN